MTVTLNDTAINFLLNNPVGPVGVDLARRASLVEEAARQNIGTDLNTRTGNLLRSVKSDITAGLQGLQAKIYCDETVAPYARFLEVGTDPHWIGPRANGGMLVSAANNPDPLESPQFVVNHPGNRAYNFLTDALRAFRP